MKQYANKMQIIDMGESPFPMVDDIIKNKDTGGVWKVKDPELVQEFCSDFKLIKRGKNTFDNLS